MTGLNISTVKKSLSRFVIEYLWVVFEREVEHEVSNVLAWPGTARPKAKARDFGLA